MSGNAAANAAAKIVRKWPVSGSTSDAIKNPAVSEVATSAITILVLCQVGFPYFSVSVFK